jgi:hypothetical protein
LKPWQIEQGAARNSFTPRRISAAIAKKPDVGASGADLQEGTLSMQPALRLAIKAIAARSLFIAVFMTATFALLSAKAMAETRSLCSTGRRARR